MTPSLTAKLIACSCPPNNKYNNNQNTKYHKNINFVDFNNNNKNNNNNKINNNNNNNHINNNMVSNGNKNNNYQHNGVELDDEAMLRHVAREGSHVRGTMERLTPYYANVPHNGNDNLKGIKVDQSIFYNDYTGNNNTNNKNLTGNLGIVVDSSSYNRNQLLNNNNNNNNNKNNNNNNNIYNYENNNNHDDDNRSSYHDKGVCGVVIATVVTPLCYHVTNPPPSCAFVLRTCSMHRKCRLRRGYLVAFIVFFYSFRLFCLEDSLVKLSLVELETFFMVVFTVSRQPSKKVIKSA